LHVWKILRIVNQPIGNALSSEFNGTVLRNQSRCSKTWLKDWRYYQHLINRWIGRKCIDERVVPLNCAKEIQPIHWCRKCETQHFALYVLTPSTVANGHTRTKLTDGNWIKYVLWYG
jgi:hypothetical protein